MWISSACELWLSKGGLSWAHSCFVFSFLMGDWANFDWCQLGTHSLICVLNAVWRALSARLLERYPLPHSTAAQSGDSPTGSFSVIGDDRSTERPLMYPSGATISAVGVISLAHEEKAIVIIRATTVDIEDEGKEAI